MTITPNRAPVSNDTLYEKFFKSTSIATPPTNFVGVKTTGIFCRPGCPARIPKVKNCEFFETAEAALKAGFRACKRCHPMRQPGEAPSLVKKLISHIEDSPERRWSETDLKALGIDPSTARRQFKKRFNMTFTQYARARRLGFAFDTLKQGDSVISAQLNAGYESASGFRHAYTQRFGKAPKNASLAPLMIDWIDTPLGPMIAICDDSSLYLLEFTTRKNIDRQVSRLQKTYGRAILPGHTDITAHIIQELNAYFAGKLTQFSTPFIPTGTAFQKSVWAALQTIPYGQTWSYAELALAIGNEKAVRAVASSNGSNGVALVIPCHRVINTGGGLGGYAGGLESKKWLLAHEKQHAPKP